MTQLEKFNETVGILVRAYLNGTLQHMDCRACAVGNICAGEREWNHIFCCEVDPKGIRQYFASGPDDALRIDDKLSASAYEIGMAIINKTGYSVSQLAAIELAFETAPYERMVNHDEVWMFNGLMAVVDVLAEIHGVDLTQKENAKLLFVK